MKIRVILWICVYISWGSPVIGYYQIPYDNGGAGDINSQMIPDGPSVFTPALYSMQLSPTSNSKRIAVLTGKSKHHLALDEWPLSIAPIHSRIVSADSDILLSNLIYSDLKIRDIIEQYRQLQMRAARMTNRDGPSQVKENDPLDNPGKANASRKARQLQDEFDRLMMILSHHNYHQEGAARAGDGKAMPVGLVSAHAAMEGSLPTGNPPENRQNRQFEPAGGSDTGIHGERMIAPHDQLGTDRFGLIASEVKDTPLPWIIRWPMKILQYLMENRIEALIYCGLLFFFSLLITSKGIG